MAVWLKRGVLIVLKLLAAGIVVAFFSTFMGIGGYTLLNAVAVDSEFAELARMTSQPDPGNIWVLPGFALMAAAGLVVALVFSVLLKLKGWREAVGASLLWSILEVLVFISLGGAWGSPLKNPLFYTVAGVFLGPFVYLAVLGIRGLAGRAGMRGKQAEPTKESEILPDESSKSTDE